MRHGFQVEWRMGLRDIGSREVYIARLGEEPRRVGVSDIARAGSS
jgi:hypothetical protein